MSENKPQVEMSHELADSSKEPTFDNEKEKLEYKWVTPAEVRTKLDNISRDKYLELYRIMESSFNEKKLTKEQYDQTIEKINELSEKELGYKITEKFVLFEKAKEALGEDCLGLEEVEKAFNIKLEAKDVPHIPFNIEDIVRAKELDQMLILRQPITMEQINDKLGGKLKDGNKLLYENNINDGKLEEDCWYKYEEFYKYEKKQTEWALVSKNVVPNSTRKDYWQQTKTLVSYIKKDVFKGGPLPEIYKEAIEEFNDYEEYNFKDLLDDEIYYLLSSSNNWLKHAKKISELKINQLLRQAPVEAIYDWVLKFQKSKERLMKNKYTRTNYCLSDGRLVSIGNFGVVGARVHKEYAEISYGDFGVVFSRKI